MKPAIIFTVLCSLWSLSLSAYAQQSTTVLTFEDARHLASRTGFGASPEEISEFVGKNRTDAVSTVVSDLSVQPFSTPPAWTDSPAPAHYRFGTMASAEKQKFRQTRISEVQSLRRWWIQEMISTPSPQTERLMLFWHNHFATAYSALNNHAISVARQHMMFRQYGTGSFRTLLKQVIRDPAMLNYLDNNNSKKQKPNENLARELLELFTLGEGSYTESDIKNAARALTGYSYSEIYDLRYVFKHWTHDNGNKEIFGKSGDFDGDDLVDLILEQPDTARYIAAKFWRILVADITKVDTKLDVHAAAFRESDYDIKTLYKSILLSDDFWAAENRATIVQSPVSLSIGAIRTTGILPTDWQTLPSRLQQMGQHLFEPPNVAGWPGGASWIAPGRLLARLEWLEQLATGSALPQDNQSTDMSMSAKPETMQPTSSMMMASADSTRKGLTIRMGAEEFDEHVKYTVRVYSHTGADWNSGELELKGGYDTKRMGRVERRNIPWQTINFPLTVSSKDVKAIEVEFLNDGATPDGADRNLYVSRASYGTRIWLASDGKQTGKCARKKPEQQGNLYCTGILRLEKSLTTSSTKTAPPERNTLRAGYASLYYVRPAKRKPHSDLVFTLSDVEFEGRFWNTLNVKYVKDKDGFAVRVNTHDCWPKCFNEWPACAWKEPNANTTVTLDIKPGKPDSERCMYDGLQAADKKLSRALWMLLDDLYEIGHGSPKMQRPQVARNYQQWQNSVDKMLQLLPDSPFYDNKIQLEILARPSIDNTLSEQVSAPLPAGLTEEQRDNSLTSLRRNNSTANLMTLLLPTKPVDALASETTTLTDVLTDLAFQLK